MNINVHAEMRAHFWEEPVVEGGERATHEFWAFRFPPPCKRGDVLLFRFDKKVVAKATVWRVEKPGESACERTGRYANRWKVWWRVEDFRDLR